ncbi:MAG: hypothetical protein A4E58_03274 [Syntrophorhabdus sp. PtaB.Bin006]|nr:MAG: hypothetical protein A4E58_03274 [Syntrophorhabdus sp. PtaB.Bin006]OPY85045.1 MAG: hypothetical protein A4E65_00207 [Syntrophorhabdus sp. PtaU1.Bin153]
METNFTWGRVLATGTEKEEIEAAVRADLREGLPITPPADGVINVHVFPDEPRDFKVLGVATDSRDQVLFKFSCSGMYPLSITYDFSSDLSHHESA